MISWNPTNAPVGKPRKHWGTSDADSSEAIQRDFQAIWQVVLLEILPSYPLTRWNSLVCGVVIDNGSFDFSPTHDCSLLRQLPGCCVIFEPVCQYLRQSFPSEQLYVQECLREEQRHLELMMQGWGAQRTALPPDYMFSGTSIPFRVLVSAEPEDPPLLDTALQV